MLFRVLPPEMPCHLKDFPIVHLTISLYPKMGPVVVDDLKVRGVHPVSIYEKTLRLIAPRGACFKLSLHLKEPGGVRMQFTVEPNATVGDHPPSLFYWAGCLHDRLIGFEKVLVFQLIND